ncbi:MAG TPA: M56 family metallopeptidase [Paludibaculum sp.]|jgi:beta-lactamase regulating signal transducer with metallopeptidase domain
METASDLVLTFLANAVWQVTLVCAVALLCVRVLRRASMAQRHALWSTALLISVLLPVLSVIRSATIEIVPLRPETEAQATAPTVDQHGRTFPLSPVPGTAVLILYGVLVAWGSGRNALAWLGAWRIRRSAQSRPLTPEMQAAEEHCRASIGLAPVPMLCGSELSGPLTLGEREPIIVLPESLFQETSPELLRSVIGHEMAHIQRRDYLQKIILELLFVPVSFHPAAWYLKRRVDQTRELACDEYVTREMVDPPAYAQSLLDVARAIAMFRKPEHSLGVLDGDILETRIRTLLKPPARFGWLAGKAMLLLGAIALIVAGVMAANHAVGVATSAGLQGTVFDMSGAVVPKATVTLIENQTGLKHARRTSESGNFSFESLPVGQYTLMVEKFGFSRFRQYRMELGRTLQTNPVLTVGMVREIITVATTVTAQ